MWIDCCYVEHKGGSSSLLIVHNDTVAIVLLFGQSDTGGYCVNCLDGAIRVAIMILSIRRDKGGYVRDDMCRPGA